jgi:hypothetical protein
MEFEQNSMLKKIKNHKTYLKNELFRLQNNNKRGSEENIKERKKKLYLGWPSGRSTLGETESLPH